jgi:hypothetical protein
MKGILWSQASPIHTPNKLSLAIFRWSDAPQIKILYLRRCDSPSGVWWCRDGTNEYPGQKQRLCVVQNSTGASLGSSHPRMIAQSLAGGRPQPRCTCQLPSTIWRAFMSSDQTLQVRLQFASSLKLHYLCCSNITLESFAWLDRSLVL